ARHRTAAQLLRGAPQRIGHAVLRDPWFTCLSASRPRRAPRTPGAEKTEPGLLHPWSDAVEEGEVPDRREHRPLVDELLYSVENHLTLRPIQLGGLLPEEAIDVGVAPIGVGAAGDGEGFEPRRSVPRRTDEQVNEVLVSLFRDALEERRALERAPGWRPDARACRARATSDRTDRRRSASGWTGTRPST